jgi:hypothetical protein
MRPSRRRRRICLVEVAGLELGLLEAEGPEAEPGIEFEVEYAPELEVIEVVMPEAEFQGFESLEVEMEVESLEAVYPEASSPEVELPESEVVEVEYF